MDVVLICPFRAGSVLWRSRPDLWTLTVVCKGTYALAPGTAALAAEQEDVNEQDNFWDDDRRRSVYASSDLAPFKPRADVMLVGHAFAPRSELARALVARLVVGEMEKAIEVFGPRVWTREGELREGPRWSKMPLRYEYAAGGLDTWNPVGIGANAPADAYGQRPLPHLQPPGLRVAKWSDIFAPVGFGPVASTWRLRREKLGRRAEGWSDEGWPQVPLDDTFDGEFFQAAPPDQQLETLHDDEPVVLEYLHPDHPRLSTKLPGVHPHAFVDIPGSAPRDLVMTADTLWIDTDRGIAAVTWRGQVAVDGPEQQGRVVIALEEAGQRLTWNMVAMAAGVTPVPPLSGATAEPQTPQHGRRPMATLPFRLGDVAQSPAAAAVQAASPAPPSQAPETPRAVGTRQTTLQMVGNDEPQPPRGMQLPGWLSQAPRLDPDLIESPTSPSTRTVPAAQPVPAVVVRVPPPADTALEVVWHASALAGRLRKHSAFAQVLSPRKVAKRDTMTMVSVAVVDTDEAAEQALEAEVSAVLARGAPSDVDLESTLFDAAAPGAALTPALLLLAGELETPFDEAAHLRAVIAAAAPVARADAHVDARLADLLDLAAQVAAGPCAPDVAASLRASIQEAWVAVSRVLPSDHLEAQAARALLLARAYQRRELLGETWVRALFTPTGGGASVPAYLPEAAAKRLPLFARFPARVLAEIVPQQDQYEEQAVALRLGAIGRVVTRSRRQ